MKITKKNKQFIVFFAIILLLWAAKDLFLKDSGDNNAKLTILNLDRIIYAPKFDLPDIEKPFQPFVLKSFYHTSFH